MKKGKEKTVKSAVGVLFMLSALLSLPGRMESDIACLLILLAAVSILIFFFILDPAADREENDTFAFVLLFVTMALSLEFVLKAFGILVSLQVFRCLVLLSISLGCLLSAFISSRS